MQRNTVLEKTISQSWSGSDLNPPTKSSKQMHSSEIIKYQR